MAPIYTGHTMARGACLLASFNSSHMWAGASSKHTSVRIRFPGAPGWHMFQSFLNIKPRNQHLQQHIPNAGCKIPMTSAIEVLNPVKFWKF